MFLRRHNTVAEATPAAEIATLWGVHRDSNGDLGESYTK
jgi:hypothetical protein